MPVEEKKYSIHCHHCHSKLSITDGMIGRKARCPVCQSIILIIRSETTAQPKPKIQSISSDVQIGSFRYIKCYACTTSLKVPTTLAGGKVYCPKCKSVLSIQNIPVSPPPEVRQCSAVKQKEVAHQEGFQQKEIRQPAIKQKEKDPDLKLYRYTFPPVLAFCLASVFQFFNRKYCLITAEHVYSLISVFVITLPVILIIIGKILYSISVRRDIQFLQTDIVTFNPKASIANRISIYNLFWDLGADATSYRIICDLQIADLEHRVFIPHNCGRVAELVKRVGGYQLFIMTLQKVYDTTPIQEELRNCPDVDSRLIALSNKIITINSQLALDLMSFDGIDFKRFKDKGIISLQYAVAGMFGVNDIVKAYNIGKNIPQIKSAAMQYYRINRQTGSESEAIFRTIEDVGVSLTASIAGNLLGVSAGVAVAQAGISEGLFDMFDFGGDGFDRFDSILILTSVALIGSILTGELFKKIGNWWRNRNLRRYIKAYNASCIDLYNTVFENPSLQQKFNDNINYFVNYWIDKCSNLEDLEKSRIMLITTIQTLVKLAINENKLILSHHVKQKKQLLKCLSENVKQGKTEIAGQLLLAHRKLVFRDMPEIQPLLNQINNRLFAVCNEYNNLKQKGLITA